MKKILFLFGIFLFVAVNAKPRDVHFAIFGVTAMMMSLWFTVPMTLRAFRGTNQRTSFNGFLDCISRPNFLPIQATVPSHFVTNLFPVFKISSPCDSSDVGMMSPNVVFSSAERRAAHVVFPVDSEVIT